MQVALERVLLTWTAPLMALLIVVEMAVTAYRRKPAYEARDTVHNLLFTGLNFGLDVLLRGVSLGILAFFWGLSPLRWEAGSLWYWVGLFLAFDFCYYVLHCADHHVRFFWATHVTHHNSERFNLTVSIRSSVFQPFYRFLFFIPLALVGFAPLHIVFMYAVCQVYGFWVHTETIGKLPAWVEAVFVTPSHHRVHHASNIRYLDRNMGMVLIVWDRIFGTFAEETERPVYGVTYRIDRPEPLGLLFGEWRKLWRDVRQAPTWRLKLAYLTKPPGWSPDGSTLTSAELRQVLGYVPDATMRQHATTAEAS